MKLAKQKYLQRMDVNNFLYTQAGDEMRDMIIDRHLDYFINNQFVLSPQAIDYAFYMCCQFNLDFSLTQKIIELGVLDLIPGCSQCGYFKNYSLLFNILHHYGKSHQIQLLQDPNFSINVNVCRWVDEKLYNRGEQQVEMEFNLFKQFIELIPNHTKKVNHSDKNYELADITYYDYQLNIVLKSMLNPIHDIGFKAFAVLAQKKFPLYQYNIQALKEKGEKYLALFANRLNPHQNITEKVNDDLDLMASNQFLKKERLSDIDADIAKTQLFYHLKIALNMPDSIYSAITQHLQMGRKKNQIQKLWPGDNSPT